MSSAILYVAIVVIWACVLIPRWLRRDSAHGAVHAPDTSSPENTAPDNAVAADTALDNAAPGDTARPGAVSGDDASDASDASADVVADDGRADSLADPDRDAIRPQAADHPEEIAEDPPERDRTPEPLTPQESRRRMLSARRRLLAIMVALEAAAISLAVLKMAALWVVIPPSVMFVWYLLLLRAAARADAEHAGREREASSLARTRERAQSRARAAQPGAAAPGPPTVAGGRPGAAAPASPAVPPVQYEDGGPGRDFAPGLAGKYTTSNAHVIDISGRGDGDVSAEAAEQKLRAVGD